MLQRPEVSFQRLARAGRAWFACIAALSAAMHSADVAAEITDLQVEFWLGGEASLQRPEFGLTDRQTFFRGPIGGSLLNGSLLPDVERSVSGTDSFAVRLPRVCIDDEFYPYCEPALSIQGTGTWQASARAGFGSLGVAASASINGSSTGIDPFGGQVLSYVGAGATARASYTDTLDFSSAVLPVGSPATFVVHSIVHATLVNAASVEPRFGVLSSLSVTYEPSVFRPATGQQFALAPLVSFTTFGGEQVYGVLESYQVQVGDTVTLKVTMAGSASGVLAEDGPAWPDTNPVPFSDGASLSAMQSLTTGISVTTPGVSLVAASGHAYMLAPVPEPGSWGLMAIGVVVLLARRRLHARCTPRASNGGATSTPSFAAA
jgi:hypothetical protein